MEHTKLNKEYVYWSDMLCRGYVVDVACCLLCKHCTDVFLDYSNGPYMFMCDLDYTFDSCPNKFEIATEQTDIMTVDEFEQLHPECKRH